VKPDVDSEALRHAAKAMKSESTRAPTCVSMHRGERPLDARSGESLTIIVAVAALSSR